VTNASYADSNGHYVLVPDKFVSWAPKKPVYRNTNQNIDRLAVPYLA
jgi:hypothetical protein